MEKVDVPGADRPDCVAVIRAVERKELWLAGAPSGCATYCSAHQQWRRHSGTSGGSEPRGGREHRCGVRAGLHQEGNRSTGNRCREAVQSTLTRSAQRPEVLGGGPGERRRRQRRAHLARRDAGAAAGAADAWRCERPCRPLGSPDRDPSIHRIPLNVDREMKSQAHPDQLLMRRARLS